MKIDKNVAAESRLAFFPCREDVEAITSLNVRTERAKLNP